jgi:hypothetical protein
MKLIEQIRAKGGQGSAITTMEFNWNERAISLTNTLSRSLKSNAGYESTKGNSLLDLKRKKRNSVERKSFPVTIPSNQTV